MNKRQKETLKLLMHSDTSISTEDLSVVFGVTSRTIRNDINSLERILEEHGAKIVKGKDLEIWLDVRDEKLFRKIIGEMVDDDNSLPVEPQERTDYLVALFLKTSDFYKIDDLADMLYVSRSTLQNDLKMVRELLLKFNLELEQKPAYGLRVQGSERHIRNAISELLFVRKTTNIVDLFKQQWLLEADEMHAIQEIILLNLKKSNINLSDISLNNLVVHIAIACKRIKSKQYAELNNYNNQDLVETEEYLVALKILQDIEEKLELTFPSFEVNYVTMHLLGTKLFIKSDQKTIMTDLDEEIIEVTKKVIDHVDDQLNLSIKNDQELFSGIAIHLKPALHRFEYRMNIRNPMLEDIKLNYPLAFEASVIGSKIIEDYFKIKINEDEIGYIALHFGAAIERSKLKHQPKRCLIVCTTGVGSSQLLYYKLKAEFSQDLNIIGTTEMHNLSKYTDQDIDLIVSTVPLPEYITTPHVVVDDILGNSDWSKIRRLISLEDKSIVEQYLDPNLIYVDLDFEYPKELLSFLAKELFEKGKTDENIVESILERESIAPTSIGNLVALPHPTLPKTKNTFWTVAILRNPIDWWGKEVQFICLLNVSTKVKESLEPMYNTLLALVDHPRTIQKLIKTKSKKEVFLIMKNMEANRT